MVRAMSPEMLQVMALVFTVWGIAVAIKAANALRSNEPYVFGMWDGGMLRAGKKLNKMGMQIKLVVGIGMAIGCVALFANLLPVKTACGVLVFVAILSFVSDFVTAE
jgi:hypothetical protein